MAQTFFLAVVAGTATAVTLLCRRAAPAATPVVVGLLIIWLLMTGVIGASGLLATFTTAPPPILRLVAVSGILTTIVAMSPLGKRVSQAPLAWLAGLHSFRILVEFFLYLGYRQGFVPVQMTWEGRNWDVLSGLSAVVMAWLAARGRLSKPALLVWNLAALALLLNIVAVAILSMPTPWRQFHNEPANIFVTQFPYVWLPVFLVQTAWFGHMIIFRRLRG
jgi:hypothetical protein